MPSLMASLGANTKPFNDSLKTAKLEAQEHGHGIASALGEAVEHELGAILAFTAVEEFFRRTFEWAEKLSNLSIRTGLPVEDLQAFEHIASKTGTSVEALVGMYEKLGVAMAAAHKEPGGDKAQGLARLGVSEESLKSGNMGQAMREIADHLKRSGDITPQLEADMKMIGKNAREVIPALKELTSENIEFEKSISLSADKMSSMKTVGGQTKDVWHAIGAAAKVPVGWIAESLLGLEAIAKVSGAFLTAPLIGDGKTGLEAARDKLKELRKEQSKSVEELSGQKLSADPYAEASDKKDKAEALKKEAQQKKEIAHLAKLTAEETRKDQLANMSADERAKKLREEVALLEDHAKTYAQLGNPLKAQESLLEAAKLRNEMHAAERQADSASDKRMQKTDKAKEKEERRQASYDVNQLQRIGAYNAAPDNAVMALRQRSENHLSRIRDAVEKLVTKSDGSATSQPQY